MDNESINITSSRKDDGILTAAVKSAYSDIRNSYICVIPNNWNIALGKSKLTFGEIKSNMIDKGVPQETADLYYGGKNCIITDAPIIYLTIKIGNVITNKPIFIGEIKKQGTNDRRKEEGKTRQPIGNISAERVTKNFKIAADYCYFCDEEFFPYVVFLHGCDFGESEINGTTLSKLKPFFGRLNVLQPFFDRNIHWERKGGSCFYQNDEYTYEQLYKICYDCCKIGILHHLSKI